MQGGERKERMKVKPEDWIPWELPETSSNRGAWSYEPELTGDVRDLTKG